MLQSCKVLGVLAISEQNHQGDEVSFEILSNLVQPKHCIL